MSEKTIFQALSEVMQEVREVKKTDRNTSQNFNFRGIDAVVNATGPAFRKFGIVVTPQLKSIDYGTLETKSGSVLSHCKVIIEFIFYGPAGDSISALVAAEAMDAGDKATAKAHSVAFRTALLQTLTLPTDEPDPDADSYERGSHTITEAPRTYSKPPSGWESSNLASAKQIGLLKKKLHEMGAPDEATAIQILQTYQPDATFDTITVTQASRVIDQLLGEIK